MRTTRYSMSRRKACKQCVAAKAKCDRKPECGRCLQRKWSCTYVEGQSSPDHRSPVPTGTPPLNYRSRITPSRTPSTPGFTDYNAPEKAFTPAVSQGSHMRPATAGLAPFDIASDEVDFSGLSLICPIRADDIANRWLNSFFADAEQVVKQYPQPTSLFIHRMLKSYVDMAIRGHDLPPFIHSSQTALSSSLPLTTCLAVIRICSGPRHGSVDIISELLNREMARLLEQQPSYDDIGLLAAFQAYLIYSMVIFFRLGQEARPSLQQAMMNLQSLACSSCRGGLMCSEEERGDRPKWEHWVAAEAKRRTLLTMYLFDSLLLTEDGLPIYLGKELTGLPAPAGRALWEAQTRHKWTARYNIHVTEWISGYLRIEELWSLANDQEDGIVEDRRRRVDLWLEGLDGFGTIIYSVTCSTHGT